MARAKSKKSKTKRRYAVQGKSDPALETTHKGLEPINVREKMQAWLDCAPVDNLADYLQRGRSYSKITDEELSANWTAIFRELAQEPLRPDLHTRKTDLFCEFEQRGLTPPLDSIREDFEKVDSAMREFGSDPESFAERSEQATKDLARFILDQLDKEN